MPDMFQTHSAVYHLLSEIALYWGMEIQDFSNVCWNTYPISGM